MNGVKKLGSSCLISGRRDLIGADVPRLGAIPSGLPQFRLPVVPQSMYLQVGQAALMLAALGAIDSLLTSLVADQLTQDYHDSDKELVGQVTLLMYPSASPPAQSYHLACHPLAKTQVPVLVMRGSRLVRVWQIHHTSYIELKSIRIQFLCCKGLLALIMAGD